MKITEPNGTIHDRVKDFLPWRNPSDADFLRLMHAAPTKELRGFWFADGAKEVLLWDAFVATHDHTLKSLDMVWRRRVLFVVNGRDLSIFFDPARVDPGELEAGFVGCRFIHNLLHHHAYSLACRIIHVHQV